MVKSLRKKHLQIWTVFAILLPLGVVSAWIVIPVKQTQNLLQPATVMALPVVLYTVEKPAYAVRIRCSRDSSLQQLEWESKAPLIVPTALIYKTVANKSINAAKDLDSAELIGRVETRGIYHFSLNQESVAQKPQFVLYDFIHRQIIDVIKF